MTSRSGPDDDGLVERFASLNVWRRGGERAPHKPLLLLCALHHKAFDRGALGLDHDRLILVSQHVRSGAGSIELLVRFTGRPLLGPQPGCPPPAPANIAWHRREVFREPARVSTQD